MAHSRHESLDILKLDKGDRATTERARSIIRRFVLGYFRESTHVEDVVQDTMVEILARLAKGEQPKDPKYWILTVASNAVHRYQTQLRRHSPAEFHSQLHTRRMSGISTRYRARDELWHIEKLLADKPERERRVLIAAALGHNYEDAAKEIGVEPRALRVIVKRLRDELGKQLQREAKFQRLLQLAREANHRRTHSGPPVQASGALARSSSSS